MKKIMIAATAFILSTPVFAQQTRQSIAIGSEIPMAATGFESTDKKEVSLNKAKTSKGLLVMFSCNTCPYVIKSEARIKEAMAMTKEKGIGMVVVNSNEAQRDDEDSYKAMAKYAK